MIETQAEVLRASVPAALFARHHNRLLNAVSSRLAGSRELAEDGCAFAWAQLLATPPPSDHRILAWLSKVAVREGRRLATCRRREQPLEELASHGDEHVGWEELVAAPVAIDDQLHARAALAALAGLPPKERHYLALLVAGYRYREIAAICAASHTNVNKHLARARARLRAPKTDLWGGTKMTIGTCRKQGCDRPRRVRRGLVEPLCEVCYREACARVSRELAAEEAPGAAKERFRRFALEGSPRTGAATSPSAQSASARPTTRRSRGIDRNGPAAASPGPKPLLTEALLREARSSYDGGQPMRAVAETLLERSGYASVDSAVMALHRQFKRRGWPVRSRRQAQALRRRSHG